MSLPVFSLGFRANNFYSLTTDTADAPAPTATDEAITRTYVEVLVPQTVTVPQLDANG